MKSAVGIFGGTFNPVHYGHLHIALELKQMLDLAEMRLVPCAIPPHRELPGVTAGQRLAMLRLAVDLDADFSGKLSIDTCELDRPGPSYTIDTLELVRQDLAESQPLCLCMGMDSFAGLTGWHRWEELLDYAHIVVAARPGQNPPTAGRLGELLAERQVCDPSGLNRSTAGSILLLETRLLPISATEIRRKLANGLSISSQVPDCVIDYIHKHELYRQENE